MSTVQRIDQALTGRPPARLAAQALADVTGRARRDAAERAVTDAITTRSATTPSPTPPAPPPPFRGPRTPAPPGAPRVDTVLHYAYGAGWGLVRAGVGRASSSALIATQVHFLAVLGAEHVPVPPDRGRPRRRGPPTRRRHPGLGPARDLRRGMGVAYHHLTRSRP